MLKLFFVSGVLAYSPLLTYASLELESPVPPNLCFSAHAIHTHNRFLKDTVEIFVKQNGSTVFSCRHNLGRTCYSTLMTRGKFDLSTRTMVLVTKDLSFLAYDMSPGWSLRKLGYGEKEYHAYTTHCS
ncbi:hypothetical protein DSO57_1033212 [Entomophthora muscae]|uniref:Uncharacterized protein n=1 Tax=Entomophthora muscae TaxID=34485 RepID=A0ACC2SDJ5_9FUNG|nr:hypothetical protein DSO57_1033212 [Entomophthora muscae]